MLPLKDNIPTARAPVVTVALILANVVAYLVSIRHGGSLWSGPTQDVAVHYGAIPYELTHPGSHCDLAGGGGVACTGMAGVSGSASTQPATAVTALTSMFMHGSLLHIAGNMLFLWIFGNNVEDRLGHVRYLVFYLLGGAAALGLQVAVGPDSTAPSLGASGAIAAVLGAYLLLYPRARVLTLVFIVFLVTIVELPALLVLGSWFVLQVLYGHAQLSDPTGGGGGVAYFAHIGGFVFGMAVVALLVRSWRAGHAAGGAPRLPVG